MKKYIICFIFVVGSLQVVAGTMGAFDGIRLFIPVLKPGVGIHGGALWLTPGASNLNYVIFNKAGDPIQSPAWTEEELQPGFGPAFNVGVNYAMEGNEGRDVQLDWIHLNSSTSTSISSPRKDIFFLGPDYEIGPEATPIQHAKGSVYFKYDVINLDGRQFLQFGENLQINFFGGLSAGFLRETIISNYSGDVTGVFSGPFNTQQTINSTFNGVGPQIGIGANYIIKNGFGLMGEADASALIGGLASKTSFIQSSPELAAVEHQGVNVQFIKDQRVYQVVPGLNAKLGADYQRVIHQGTLTVSAGYQAAIYVNAISQYLPGSLVDGHPVSAGGIFVATMAHTLSNYSVQGPFLTFSYKA